MSRVWTVTAARPLPLTRRKGGPVEIRPRRVRYGRNGLRSVPIERTLAGIDRFFLASDLEVQFGLFQRGSGGKPCACLEYLSPDGEDADERYFGKGASLEQAFASACCEFFERHAAKMRPEDEIAESSFKALGSGARDPRSFDLATDVGFTDERVIDWVPGRSLTRAETVWVPANLVFLPYKPGREEKRIAKGDSNGLAAGNNLEEAVLHGVLELVERDALVIAEYNRLPMREIDRAGLPAEILVLLDRLADEGYAHSLRLMPTDLPVTVVSAFLTKLGDPCDCSVAVGCHLDPKVACERALTEAVQLLPPASNQNDWRHLGDPGRYMERTPDPIDLGSIPDRASPDLKANIATCVESLRAAGAEVIVVDLSLEGLPFPAVRVLAPGLQPLARDKDRRLSRRFFDVPVELGLRDAPLAPDEVRIWPLCGYR
jgi:ribosomal protein S12 methylthiotransferase accessory factor YcaO